MLQTNTPREVEIPDRLCYYCNEGQCARCTGWDQTVVDGEVVMVACAHECRSTANRKNVQSVTPGADRPRRKA